MNKIFKILIFFCLFIICLCMTLIMGLIIFKCKQVKDYIYSKDINNQNIDLII